tara:strand:- start:105680 stop:108169 length:2490 start_codon:yes stop_codon:yes gene_type:complete
MKLNITIAALLCFAFASCNKQQPIDKPISISGVYPHLAFYNNEGECGTGAVVPWADRLWVVTYGPHFPRGSSDKLYEITPDLKQIVRDESIGGTPANRMIHEESNQLFIGPHAIDAQGNVRTIPYADMQGRHTGNARHLTNPAEKIYYASMEEGFYEVDVNTLEVKELYKDGHDEQGKHMESLPEDPLPGYSSLYGDHGKGLYSGQGVLVYSNNGERGPGVTEHFDIESGSLSEWDGKEWKLVRRCQFVEITGPGGIYGNENPDTDPIWATGWDPKSLVLGVRNVDTGWSFYRLPKASHSYDGAHGWNTEWPRIRDVGTAAAPDYLMTMHGMFWRFPQTFSTGRTAGIRPRSAYLKVIGDFTRWNDQLVFGCDDSAQREFLNKRKVKGSIEGPGQSNSNLWFTSMDTPDKLGPNTAEGAVWLNEEVKANEISEPFLFSGWPYRTAWVKNEGGVATTFTFEVDAEGSGKYEAVHSITIPGGESKRINFTDAEAGEWVRVKSDRETTATVHFYYSDKEERSSAEDDMFTGIASVNESESIGGLLYGLGDNRRALGVAATQFSGAEAGAASYYELDEKLNLFPKKDEQTLKFIQEKFAIPDQVVTVEKSSVLVIDDRGRRWRLPLSSEANFTGLTNASALRIDREVATERDLMNCHGTFYELPAENADGFAKIRPVSSHGYRIHDYASYRGLLVMTGISPSANTENEHIIVSEDGKAAVWAGVIDDLWKLGKPTGQGGPWYETEVTANVPSDPYLIGFYDDRSLSITHDGTKPVNFRIEVEPVGHGPWMVYDQVSVAPGETFRHQFPSDFQARWIRFTTDSNVKATTKLVYK